MSVPRQGTGTPLWWLPLHSPLPAPCHVTQRWPRPAPSTPGAAEHSLPWLIPLRAPSTSDLQKHWPCILGHRASLSTKMWPQEQMLNWKHYTVSQGHQRVPLCCFADRYFRNRRRGDFKQPHVLQMKPLLQIFSSARKEKTTKCSSALHGHREKNVPLWDFCFMWWRPTAAVGAELSQPTC